MGSAHSNSPETKPSVLAFSLTVRCVVSSYPGSEFASIFREMVTLLPGCFVRSVITSAKISETLRAALGVAPSIEWEPKNRFGRLGASGVVDSPPVVTVGSVVPPGSDGIMRDFMMMRDWVL